MPKPIDLKKIVNFDIDYYALIGLEKGCLLEGRSREITSHNVKIVGDAMRAHMWSAHPDHPGGSAEKFKLVLHAQWILENPIWRKYYESGGESNPRFAEESAGFDIDWDNVGNYQQGTQADTVGYGLFTKLNERAKELGIVPAFFPEDSTHSYEWDWSIPDLEKKLSLALVYDVGDILRLTGGDQVESFLPFKIYFCFPRMALQFLRGEKETFTFDEDCPPYEMNGKLRAAIFSDYDLLETTNLQDALDYISPGGKIENDLKLFRDGTLVSRKKQFDKLTGQKQWLSSEELKAKDIEALKNVLRMTSYILTPDPHGADFLDKMPD